MGAVVPSVVDAVDPDELIGRLDVDALMAKVDVDALLARIDIEALLSRIDVDALLGRIDVGVLIARIDMNEVIGKVDLNVLLADVDLNALMDGVDIRAIIAKAGIDEIVAEASTGVLTRTLDLARRQLVGIDIILMGAIDRLFRRERPALPDTPTLSASGRAAGPVSRLIAFGLDLFFVSSLFSLVVYFGRSMVELFTGDAVQPTSGAAPLLWSAAYLLWFGLYLWGSIEISGRTPGKALVGLRVSDLEGRPLGPGRALVRTLVFPFSFILGLGFVPMITRKDRRALHELVAGCKEIVDWGDRQAGIPSALEGWVARQRNAQQVAGLTEPAAGGAEVIELKLEVVPKADQADRADRAGTEATDETEEGAFDEDGELIAALDSTPVLTEAVDQTELEDRPAGVTEADYWAG
ncbi:MAG: hypothetical protein JWO77_3775 [Ilumatobacteraceae bacterium]|nr:hypothetical protein [Ilumatobacteraceae bacterium]